MPIFLLHRSKIGALSEWKFRASKTKPPHKRRTSEHLWRFFFCCFFLGNWGCEEERRKKRHPKALSPFWIAASRAAFASSCCWSSFMDAMASSLLLPSFPRSPLLPLVRTTDLVDNRQPRGGYGPHNQPQWESLFSSTNRTVIKFSSKEPRGAESFDQITRLDEIIVPCSMW